MTPNHQPPISKRPIPNSLVHTTYLGIFDITDHLLQRFIKKDHLSNDLLKRTTIEWRQVLPDDTCLPPGPMAACGGMCQVLSGKTCRYSMVVLFDKLFEMWSFLTID
jgi:hypothetical protein